MKLSNEALKARRKYYRDYRAERRMNPANVKHDKDYLKKWRQAHPDKAKEYLVNFWQKRADKTTVTDIVTDKNKVTIISNANNNSNEITCAICGASFIAKRTDSKYCSPACKQKHYRLKD